MITRGQAQITWDYDSVDQAFIYPAKFFGDKKGYRTKVLSMPAYSHDLTQVEDLLEQVGQKAPLCAPVTITLLQLIDARHTNGWAQQQWDHSCYTPDDCQCDVKIPKTPPPKSGEQVTSKKRNWDGVIVLSGRTTEIHPAIARYVVPHEYGHILEDCLGQIRYPHDSHNCGAQVVKEWAKVRRLPQELFSQRYSPTTHHLMPTEVFANDFRHALGFETEWWPHEDVCRPLGKRGTVKAVRWWNDALDQLKDCHREAQNALH